MLLTNAECLNFDAGGQLSLTRQSIRIERGIISELGVLSPAADEKIFDVKGGAVFPGLHDHHVHLASYAASLGSVNCGPPGVSNAIALIDVLNQHDGNSWLRGVNYHESVAGDIDRAWLDLNGPPRPIRIQHRTGRLWILNSLALDAIDNHDLPADGRLYESDHLIRSSGLPKLPLAEVSQRLASYGVTGANDMTPSNDGDTLNLFSAARKDKSFRQKLRLSGSPKLSQAHEPLDASITIGETKVHLHESWLIDFDIFCNIIRASHAQSRPVAVHCVTETELVFTLSAFQTAGTIQGDRIEHASVIPTPTIELIHTLNLLIVTQPNFIRERGDTYLADIKPKEHHTLYRCRSLQTAGISVAFGTDLPFGLPDPWVAIDAATTRTTHAGNVIGTDEIITPEAALAAYLGGLDSPAKPRRITSGDPADLCIMEKPWSVARQGLSSVLVRCTMIDGELIYCKDSSTE
ncbi:MAG: amidohydrolase family protein [Pseudomonadota bacterium]